jgi:hypothetical protein
MGMAGMATPLSTCQYTQTEIWGQVQKIKHPKKIRKKPPQPDRIKCCGGYVIFSTVPLCPSLCLGVERTGNIFSGCFFAKTEA